MKSGKVVILHSTCSNRKSQAWSFTRLRMVTMLAAFFFAGEPLTMWQWPHCVCMYREKSGYFWHEYLYCFCTTSSPLTYQIHCERDNTENFDYPWIVRHFSLAFLLDWLSCLRSSSGCFNPQLPMLIPLNLKTNEGKLSATLASVNFIEFRPIAYTALFIICFMQLYIFFICFSVCFVVEIFSHHIFDIFHELFAILLSSGSKNWFLIFSLFW